LKIQFPVDARQEPNEAAWRAACAELNDAAPVPWTLLTAGDPFEMYLTQLQIACEAGCAGFLAGRTVWSDVAAAVEGARDATLTNIVRPRLKELNRVADRFGHGWQEKSTCLQTNLAQAEFSETS
jgi:tagatose 1,6-diphosphate aldolase